MTNEEIFNNAVDFFYGRGAMGLYIAFFYSKEFILKIRSDNTLNELEKETIENNVAKRKHIASDGFNLEKVMKVYDHYSVDEILIGVLRKFKRSGKDLDTLKSEILALDDRHLFTADETLARIDKLWDTL